MSTEDVHAANRRFEFGLGIDPHEPRDDNKTWEDLSRYPTQPDSCLDDGEVIATFYFGTKTGKLYSK